MILRLAIAALAVLVAAATGRQADAACAAASECVEELRGYGALLPEAVGVEELRGYAGLQPTTLNVPELRGYAVLCCVGLSATELRGYAALTPGTAAVGKMMFKSGPW